MNKHLFPFFLLLIAQLGFSQNKPTQLEFFVGYPHSSFLNRVYTSNLGNDIERKMGIQLGARYVVRSAVGFHLQYFNSPFSVNLPNITEKMTARHTGFEVGADLNLIPAISQYFSPYAGLAYQNASLLIAQEDKSNSQGSTSNPTPDKVLSSLDVSAPLWKFGLRAVMSRISIQAEYKQSFSTAERGFNQFSVTLGYLYFNE